MKTPRWFTGNRLSYLRIPAAVTLIAAAVVVGGIASAFNPDPPPPNTRLTNDDPSLSGYTSDYTMVTGAPYTDAVLTACSQSRGRQNEPAVAVDPRNPQVIVGSSNDYCGVFQSNGALLGLGDVWLGYYRSQNGGASFVSSLVPGYQGDTSPLCGLGARADRRLRRSRAGLGQPRTGLRRLGELQRSGGHREDPRRCLGGDIREPAGRERPDDR